jgi:hypothetical protein
LQAESRASDAEVRAALDWFLDVVPDRSALEQRIRRAQQYYRTQSAPNGLHWPETARLVLSDDLIACCLAQGAALLDDRRSYDRVLGAQIVPFLASIGQQVELLRRRPGATERVRRMLHPRLEYPGAGLLELAAAARYAREDFDVAFAAESGRAAGDLAIRIAEIPRAMEVECRALRRSRYELRERALARRLFAPLAQFIHARALSLDVEVGFGSALEHVPENYLVEHALGAVASPSSLPEGHRWRDEFGEGVVRSVVLDRIGSAMRTAPLTGDAQMAQLLSGRAVPRDAFLLAMKARPDAQDPRLVAEVDYASVLSWHCLAEESLGARVRQLRLELDSIDRQLANADVGIVHIGMEGECDAVTADHRRSENLKVLRAFNPRSRIAELHLHYFQPLAPEAVDRHSRWHGFLLEDARLLPPVPGAP